jgi:drug/metabolite transporter (DMT)-like permease
MAMKYERASINGVIEDVSTVLCFLADIFYFHVSFQFWGIIGTLLIVFACLIISISKIE